MKSQYMKIINLFCKTCDYQSSQKGNLRTHEESVHGGSKFAFKMSDGNLAILVHIFNEIAL